MSYIGRDIRTGAFRQLDDISSGFDGSDATHTMQVNSTNVSVGDVNQILLSLGGVIQKPGTDFTVSGSTLTFTTAPAANTSFFAILLGSDNGGTVTPTDASVTVDKLAILGGEVKLDADGDTSITADTDDQIDFKVGGNDTHVFDANGHVTLKQFLDATTAGGRVTGASNRGSNARVNLYQTAGSSDGGEIRLETANTSNSMTEAVRIHNNQVMSASAGVALGLGTANTASNVLDDYEEGTHTASITDSSGDVTSITLNSSFNQLSYTKVGRQVFVGGTLVISSFSGSWGSGQCRITLPFAVGDLTDRGGGVTGSIGTYSVDYTTGTAPYLVCSEGNSYATIQVSGYNITGGNGQPSNSAQLYIGLTYMTA